MTRTTSAKGLRALVLLASLFLATGIMMAVVHQSAYAAEKIDIGAQETGWTEVKVAEEKFDIKTGTLKQLNTIKKGKQVKPKVTVTYSAYDEPWDPLIIGSVLTKKDEECVLSTITLKEGRDYTLSFKNNKKPGIATVVVTGMGAYTGKISQQFIIYPQQTKITKIKRGKRTLTVQWKKIFKPYDYEVKVYKRGAKYKETAYFDKTGAFLGFSEPEDKNYASTKKYTRYRYKLVKSVFSAGTSLTIKGLKAKTKYFVTVTPRACTDLSQNQFDRAYLLLPFNERYESVYRWTRSDGELKYSLPFWSLGSTPVILTHSDPSDMKAVKTR